MNKSAISITILAILTLTGYLLFDKFFNSNKEDLWDAVSENAALVIEVSATEEKQDFSYLSDELNLIQPLISSTLDSLVYHDFNNQGFSKMLASVHQISNTSIGLTYFVDFSNVLKSSLLSFFGNKEQKIESRQYLDATVRELEIDDIKVSFLIENNQLFFSKHSFLIEDIIRLKKETNLKKFNEVNSGIMFLPKLVNDAANLYLNVDRLSSLTNSFINTRNTEISKYAKNIFFDASLSEKVFTFNGFTQYYSNSFLSTFKNQVPVQDKFNYIIPTNAAVVTKALTSDAKVWETSLIEYWTKQEPSYLLKRNDYFKNYNFKNDQFFNQIKDGVCQILFFDKPSKERLIYVSLKDKNEVLNQLNNFSNSLAVLQSDSVYTEQYGEYTISELKIPDFPKFLFGPGYSDFETTYYVIYNDILILSNGISTIKNLFSKIENEETWGRELSYNDFFDNGLQEVNYSYSFNLQQLWPQLFNILNPTWSQYAQDRSIELKKYKLWMLQFSKIDNSYYTNLTVEKQQTSNEVSPQNIETIQSLAFNIPLISRPFAVRNHNTNLLETIIQDSLFNLHLISSEGKQLWAVKLNGKLRGEVEQIDFYKNNKLQYFLTTDKSIYIIDRLGNYVEGYPKNLDFEISGSKVVDYDKTRKYRFLVVDVRGNLYLYDKEGNELQGWQPLAVNGIHSFTPFHQRVRGKDSFTYLLQNGSFTMVNRRGETLAGFPIQLEGKFMSKPFVSLSSDYQSSYVTFISNSGKLTKVNFLGEVLSESQLFKQGKETTFMLIPDALGKTYLIARQEENRIVILDENGAEKFAKDYLGIDEIKLQYYYFSPENQVCVIIDTVQGLAYLYNSNGLLLHSRPIDSDYEIGVIFSESKNEYTIYTVSNSTFKKFKF